MVPTLISMDLWEQLTTLLPGNAPYYDTISAAPVEIPFYQCVSLSQTVNPISGCTVIGKGVFFQVGPDLHDPCIRTDLSSWILCARVHGVPRDTYDPWWTPWD
jgi:hypothetical protein